MHFRKLSIACVIAIAGLLAQASLASAFRSANSTSVAIPTVGGVSPAPSVEMRAPGTIESVSVNLSGLSHTYPTDLDIAIESPSGTFVMLMSDACGTTTLNSVGLNFEPDGGWPTIPQNTACSGTLYLPANYVGIGSETFTTAPGATISPSLASFAGEDPNGIWKLHIEDDSSGDSGSLASFQIYVRTVVDPSLGYTRVPATGSGSSSSTAVSMSKEVKLPRPIADVDVVLRDLSHAFPEDLSVLLVSPVGTGVVLMSEQCSGASFLRSNFRFDDAALSPLPAEYDSAGCQPSSATVRPGDDETVETAIAGAPVGPYASALSAFNGQSATGTWKLYLLDDQAGSAGFIRDFELAITQVPTKQLKVGRASLKYKKSGKSKILARGRIPLSGATLATGECVGTAKTTFQTKTTRKKGKKRVTVYKRVASTNSRLRLVKSKCEVGISAKLAKKYSNKKLRLVVDYRGGDYLSPFKRNLSVKVKRLKFN